jgi:hypothetical protein
LARARNQTGASSGLCCAFVVRDPQTSIHFVYLSFGQKARSLGTITPYISVATLVHMSTHNLAAVQFVPSSQSSPLRP